MGHRQAFTWIDEWIGEYSFERFVQFFVFNLKWECIIDV